MIPQIFGLTAETFNAKVRGKQMRLGRLDSYELLGMDWEGLSGLIDYSDADTDAIELVRQHQRADRRNFVFRRPGDGQARIQPPAVRRALNDGYSVTCRNVHLSTPSVRRLSERLMRDLGAVVSVNIYGSWTSDRCFLTHWDEHDVLIIQTAGEKLWSVFHPTRAAPLPFDVDYDTDARNLDLAWEGVLTPGDVLYLPRGWWHHAQARDEGSVHLTAGFRGPTTLDLVQYLMTRASEHEQFRQDLPLLVADDETNRTNAESVADALTTFLGRELDSGLFQRFWRDNLGALPTYPPNHLPYLADLNFFRKGRYELAWASGSPVAAWEVEEDGAFSFQIAGIVLTLAAEAMPVLDHVIDRGVCTLEELRTRFGDDFEDIDGLVFELAVEGILEIRAVDHPATRRVSTSPVSREAVHA